MGLIYTEQEIGKIHGARKAVPGQFYEDVSGKLYIGRSDGYLKQEIQSRGEVKGTSLRTVIENIGEYSREDIIELLNSVNNNNWVTEKELETAKKELKCFSVAIAIVL